MLLSEASTPREYVAVLAAIKREMANPEVKEELEKGPGLGQLNWTTATRVPLGSLGPGIMVNFLHSPSCGTGGCPMWLFLHGPHGYRNVIKAAGWGFSLVASGGSVPDISFYWQMGASETDVGQYHYAHGKFVPVVPDPASCGGEDDIRGVCAGRSSENWLWSITSAEYDSMRLEVQAVAKPSALASQQISFDQAHAIDFSLVNDKIARIVGIGSCTPDSNCTISVYGCKKTYPRNTSLDIGSIEAGLPKCEYWPMLRGVSGWGVADASDFDTDPFSPQVALVIARRLSATEVELARYSVVTEPTGPQPGSTLLLDSCAVVRSKTGKWPAYWDTNVLEARPEACGASATENRHPGS